MKIRDIYKQKRCVFSLECFPPKQTANFDSLKQVLREMAGISPDFISVTCGAAGTAKSSITPDVTIFVKNELGIETMAHITCTGSDRNSVRETLEFLRANDVDNILALRGDISPVRPVSKDFAHANDLMFYLHFLDPEVDIAGACYPEGHPESESPAFDIEALRFKQAAGASHLITQLFFDNSKYYRFLNRARKEGIGIPVSAGIMPIVKKSQIERTVALSSASLPSEFTRMIARWQDDEDGLFKAGIEYAVDQIRDLIEGGADGIHLYAMNNSEVALKVYEGISDLL